MWFLPLNKISVYLGLVWSQYKNLWYKIGDTSLMMFMKDKAINMTLKVYHYFVIQRQINAKFCDVSSLLKTMPVYGHKSSICLLKYPKILFSF